MSRPMKSPGRYVIDHPSKYMDLDERAFQMWAVHPSDLSEFGMTREEFYLAHLEVAVEQATRK